MADTAPSTATGPTAYEYMSFEPLTPTACLDRAAASNGDRVAVVDGPNRWTYAELHDRCGQLGGALAPPANHRPVAVPAHNTHVLLEAHYGVRWAGAPLVSINTRLSAAEIVHILRHSEAAVLVHDPVFDNLIDTVYARLTELPVRITAGQEYEAPIAGAEPLHSTPTDERALLSINYTSGTTGRPKGVMYHHRGAYLQALAMAGHTGLTPTAVRLRTLPMFHRTGWCFPWAVTAAAATQLCLPEVDLGQLWRLIREEGVTHLNGAPTVLSMIAYAKEVAPLDGDPVHIATGGAPPSPAILRRMSELGFAVTHLYGLTETYGRAMLCDWREEWNQMDTGTQSRLKARQGVGNMIAVTPRVIAADSTDVPADGITTGHKLRAQAWAGAERRIQ